MKLLLHPLSQKRYDSTVANPPQSILLVAPAGSGKETLLKSLTSDILGSHPAGRLFELLPMEDKSSIGIEAIRDLKMMLRLKSAENRVVLITKGSSLTIEAQNSLLKILEEPPRHVHFLIGVNVLGEVLDTIQSRSTVWRLNLPSQKQLREYFSSYPDKALSKALVIGESRVGLISAMLQEEQNHPLLQAIETAKEILGEDHFNRLLRVDSLSKNVPQTKVLLEAMELVCKAAVENAAGKNSHTTPQWNKRLKFIVESQENLSKNIQTKLILSHLFLVL